MEIYMLEKREYFKGARSESHYQARLDDARGFFLDEASAKYALEKLNARHGSKTVDDRTWVQWNLVVVNRSDVDAESGLLVG